MVKHDDFLIRLAELMRYSNMSDTDVEKRGLKRTDINRDIQNLFVELLRSRQDGFQQQIKSSFFSYLSSDMCTDKNARQLLTLLSEYRGSVRFNQPFATTFYGLIGAINDAVNKEYGDYSKPELQSVIDQEIIERFQELMRGCIVPKENDNPFEVNMDILTRGRGIPSHRRPRIGGSSWLDMSYDEAATPFIDDPELAELDRLVHRGE
jgi:hypothetical protein